jgi:hypothetical protein
MALALHLLGCRGEVIHRGPTPEDGKSADSGGGLPEDLPEPTTTCRGLGLLMESQPRCTKVWPQAACENGLQFGVEHGCLEETLDLFECSAATCEDPEACRGEIDHFLECREDIAD